jgi:hypothetical protein
MAEGGVEKEEEEVKVKEEKEVKEEVEVKKGTLPSFQATKRISVKRIESR